ncbi:MAG: lipoyl(octanoyl) transferase LipB [Thermoplasmatales archaeon]|nr:lipoyl(octanoyl) transferase LipB [Thermoplasmatales archaeon]MCW6170639.1 lipoyl(octanoyl) transferase LipB [Thermoplasmatales archaeon]
MTNFDPKRKAIVAKLGTEDYARVLNIQHRLNSARNSDRIGDVVIFLQHNDVYTAGIHFKGNVSDLPAPFYQINRGGYLTYHGPGQIVVYFIRNLHANGENVKELIEKIQNSVISTLNTFGITGRGLFNEKTGVWVDDKKICSIGLGIEGFSTLHGMALNVDTDLNKFKAIDPCNFDPEVMTSISRLIDRKITVDEVQPILEKEIFKNLCIGEKEFINSIESLEKLSLNC